jgi:CRP-like cAMP-binding protein
MAEIRDTLAEHPFFRGLAREYLDMLAGLTIPANFEAEEFIFQQGEESREFYAIVSGRVALQIYSDIRGSIAIDTVGGGDVMGWTWIVEPFKRRFDAQALEYTRTLALDGVTLREKCEENPALGYELLKRFSQVMAGRLESARLRLLDVYGIPLPRERQ